MAVSLARALRMTPAAHTGRAIARCLSSGVKGARLVRQTLPMSAALPRTGFNRTLYTAGRSLPAVRPSGSLRRAFATETVDVPSLGDSISEGTLASWNKAVGDSVEVDEVVAVLETDKVSVDINSSVGGVLTETMAEEGDTVSVGDALFKVDTSAEAAPKKQDKKQEAAAPASAPKQDKKEDSAPAPKKAAPAAKEPAAKSAPAPVTTGQRTETRVPMNRMRQRIAQRLQESQTQTASLTTFQECDMSALMQLRSQYKDAFLEKHGVKLGFMSGFVRASTVALQENPDINAVIEGSDIVYRDYVDISVAVATPNGLVVPVLRNCQDMSFADVEGAIAALGAKARKGQIAIEDMVGGTFTISNGGVYGSLMGTPIINLPQSAILGMHGIFKRPVAIGDNIEIRPMMNLALTYDHRLVDGKGAVTFLRRIKDLVEDPRRMLLDV